MKVLFWTCGFEPRNAGPGMYASARRLGYDCAIAGSRTNPDEFIAKFREYKPDVVFCSAILAKLEPYYREIRRTALLVFWYPDQTETHRDRMWQQLGGKAQVMIFSILDTAWRYRDLATRVVWMPQYFDHLSCLNEAGVLPQRRTEPEFDLAFFGSTDVVRREWLSKLAEKYKCNFVTDRIGRTGEIRGWDMAMGYANAKIAFNIQRRDFDHTGPFITSNRIYNAMGSGCMYISHPVERLGYLFKEGYHCVTHDGTFKDLCNKIDYYLENHELRETIARQGQQCVLANHTLVMRMNEYLRVCENVLHGTPAPTHSTSFGCWVAGYWSEGLGI